jgi:hypothetical protein
LLQRFGATTGPTAAITLAQSLLFLPQEINGDFLTFE